MYLPLITLAFIVLLPTIPAYLLFKALPATADVSGPFQGLTIKLSGAFAGYFVVLLVVFAMHNVWNPAPVYQAWEIDGQVTDEKGSALPDVLDPGDIVPNPNPLRPNAGGSFKLTIVTMPGPGGGMEYPDLVVGHHNYLPTMVPLEPASLKQAKDKFQVTIDAANRHIYLNKISLSKVPASVALAPSYSGAGTPPSPIPAGQEPHQ